MIHVQINSSACIHVCLTSTAAVDPEDEDDGARYRKMVLYKLKKSHALYS